MRLDPTRARRGTGICHRLSGFALLHRIWWSRFSRDYLEAGLYWALRERVV